METRQLPPLSAGPLDFKSEAHLLGQGLRRIDHFHTNNALVFVDVVPCATEPFAIEDRSVGRWNPIVGHEWA
jgi:hypothetical protein